jgi:ubiquitin C-terminal hydrolase
MCTHCRRKENGTVKNLKIWTTPPVLIIHLKRFCQTKMSNSKLTYPVQFPLVNLNVKRFLSTNRCISNENGIDDEQEDFIEEEEEEDDDDRQYGLYDLFAVCNHRGSMSNGHYTGKIHEQWEFQNSIYLYFSVL